MLMKFHIVLYSRRCCMCSNIFTRCFNVTIQLQLYHRVQTITCFHCITRINSFLSVCLRTCSSNFVVVSLKWIKLWQSLRIDVHQLGWPTEPNSCLNLEHNPILRSYFETMCQYIFFEQLLNKYLSPQWPWKSRILKSSISY